LTVEELLAALQGIIDAAQAENRPLNEDEMARYEQLEGQLALVRRDAEIRARQAAYTTPIRTDLHIHAAGVDVVERSDQEIAFEAYLRSGQPNSDLMQIERAQSVGTDTQGGYLVPDSLATRIIERRRSIGRIASIASTITTDSGEPLTFPTADDNNSAEIVPENSAPAGGADLVLGQKTLGAYKYDSVGAGALPLKVSFELAQDSAFPIETFVGDHLGRRIARKQARDFAIGSGSGEPQGLLTGATSSDEIAGTVPTYAELLAATFVPDAEYLEDEAGVAWVMHPTILQGILGILDDNGRPLVNTSTDGISGRPARTLLGWPVLLEPSFPATWGDQAKTVVFGNVREAYLIRYVKAVSLIVLRELYAINGQIAYMSWARADAIVQDSAAITALSGANV
jgi:HK97 family phage major capsid protein